MATIQFENGTKVNFDGNPTPQDVEEVANKLGLSKQQNGTLPTQDEVHQNFMQKTGNVVSGIGDFWGIGSLGKGLANVAYDKLAPTGLLGKESKDLVDKVHSGNATPEQYKAYADIYSAMPSKKAVIGSAIQTGANVLSAGLGSGTATNALGRIAQVGAQSAGIGGALGFGKGLEENNTVRGALKEGATTGIATGIVGVGIGGVAELAKYLVSSGIQEGIVNKTLKIPTKVIEKGKSPAPRILDEVGIASKKGIIAKSDQAITTTNEQIQKALKGNTTPIDSSKIITTIREKLNNTYGLVLTPDEIDGIVQKLPLSELNKNPQISVETLNKVRQVIDNQYLGSTKWLNNSTAESITGLKTAANVMRNIVKGTTPETQSLFAKMADYITTKNALNKDLAKPHVVSNLLELMGSGLYGLTSGGFSPEGVAKTVAGFTLLKAFLSTPGQLGLAQGLKVAGKVGGSAIVQGAGKVTGMGVRNVIKNIAK